MLASTIPDIFPASFGLGIVLWKHLLEGVLEGQVEGLGGEVAQAVGEVAIPEAKRYLAAVGSGSK